MYEILCCRWAFSIALDIGHAQGMWYMDARICFCISTGMLVNAHVIALPFHTNKMAETQFNTACKALDPIDSSWQSRIVSFSTEGERAMTGQFSGVQNRFQQVATFHLVRVWGGLHQIDLFAQKKYSSFAVDMFATTLAGLIAYLGRKQNLTAEIKTTCSDFVSTR